MDILVATSAGFLSFVSPCVLPLIPSYLAIIAGISVEELRQEHFSKRLMFLRSLVFVIGLIIPMIILGVSASALGQSLQLHQTFISQLLGFVVIFFGLHLLGLLRFQLFQREFRFDVLFTGKQSLISLAVMGMAFGFGWTPCIGPMLSSILILASEAETVWRGGYLLTFYGLGLGVPFLLLGLFSTFSWRLFEWLKQYLHVVSIISGILLIILGALLITGNIAYLIPAGIG